MSRSRRKRRIGKCSCGLGHIPYRGRHQMRRGRVTASCPILEYPHEINDQFSTYLRERELPLPEED